jgi:hypothetical protein
MPLRRNGRVWTTDKDGLILGLLATEITTRTGRHPGEHHAPLVSAFGASFYTRIDAPATVEQNEWLKKLLPESVSAVELAGDAITAKMIIAPATAPRWRIEGGDEFCGRVPSGPDCCRRAGDAGRVAAVPIGDGSGRDCAPLRWHKLSQES